jgi:hypothetical protein
MAISTNLARVHRIGLDGQAYQEPIAQDRNTGQTFPFPVTNPGPIPLAEVQAANCIVKNGSMNFNPNGLTLPPAVGIAETPAGQVQPYRSEGPSVQGQREQWTITINNAELTTEEFVIGDASGLLRAKLGVGAPKAGVTFGGTFGANTYDLMRTVSGYTPIDLHGLHIINKTTLGATSTAFFDTGFLRLAQANLANNGPIDNEVPLRDLVFQDSFQTNIRQDRDWRFQMMSLTGVHVSIPTGQSITITFQVISAAGLVSSMQRISNAPVPRG